MNVDVLLCGASDKHRFYIGKVTARPILQIPDVGYLYINLRLLTYDISTRFIIF